MADGLLGSFDGAMEGLDDSVTTADAGRSTADIASNSEPVETTTEPPREPTTSDEEAPRRATTTAQMWVSSSHRADRRPAREIDERARQTAALLLRRSSAPTTVAHLVETESGRRQRIDGPVVIGRGEDDTDGAARFAVTHALASRNHCRVRPTPTGHVIVDEGSANGTFVLRGDDVVLVDTNPFDLHGDDIIATAGGQRHLARYESTQVNR